jgi:excisionase family DNA binding protein
MAKKKNTEIEIRRPRTTRPTNPKSILITLTAAAFELGWPRGTLYTQIARGHLPIVTVGKRRIWIKRADLDAFIASRTERRDQ